MGFILPVVYLAFLVALCMGGWKAFVKAGLPGWAFLVPYYNIYLMWQMTDKPILVVHSVPCSLRDSLFFQYSLELRSPKPFGQSVGSASGSSLLVYRHRLDDRRIRRCAISTARPSTPASTLHRPASISREIQFCTQRRTRHSPSIIEGDRRVSSFHEPSVQTCGLPGRGISSFCGVACGSMLLRVPR